MTALRGAGQALKPRCSSCCTLAAPAWARALYSGKVVGGWRADVNSVFIGRRAIAAGN